MESLCLDASDLQDLKKNVGQIINHGQDTQGNHNKNHEDANEGEKKNMSLFCLVEQKYDDLGNQFYMTDTLKKTSLPLPILIQEDVGWTLCPQEILSNKARCKHWYNPALQLELIGAHLGVDYLSVF